MTTPACPLCTVNVDETLWQDDFCRVIWVEDENYPGFCRVILNAHVKEMTDLPPLHRQRLMMTVMKVETVLREVLSPDKINLASLGNVVPHLHWHVIPRWADDVNFPDAIWASPHRASPQRAVTQPAAAKCLPGRDLDAIRQQIQERLTAVLEPDDLQGKQP